MAGSYEHCINEKNPGEVDLDLIENMHDAGQALRHMFYMIDYLTEGDPEKIRVAVGAAYFKIRQGRFPGEEKEVTFDFDLVYERIEGRGRMLLLITADDGRESSRYGPWLAKEAAIPIVEILSKIPELGFASPKDAEFAYITKHLEYMSAGMNGVGELYPTSILVIDKFLDQTKE